MMKIFALSCLVAAAYAAPAAEAEAEADPQYFGYGGHAAALGPIAAPLVAPVAYHTPNCVTEEVILVTQVCTPSAEEVCSTETVPTEEIEYEKICQDVVDTICDTPIAAGPIGVAGYHGIYKRSAEAEAEAEPQYFAAPGYAYGHAAAPLAVAPLAVAPIAVTAVAHSIKATVRHACREITTEHCVENPKVKSVPVEVEHCHTVTKVDCAPVENILPKTTCEAVVTQQVAGYGAAPFHAGYAGHF